MRILAIDYGKKRLGIALSDPLRITAQPQPWIANDKRMMDNLTMLIKDHEVSEIVVGLPLHLSGEPSAMSSEIEEFAKVLQKQSGVKIELQDERLTTAESEKVLIDADVSRSKRKEIRDSMVASIILQDYLERKKHA